MNQKEKSILYVTCYGHFMSHFNMLVFPAVLIPLSQQFAMSMAETLSLSFWMYLLFGVSALPWGLLADKVGTRTLLAVFHIGAGISGIVAAYSYQNPKMFALSLAGVGLFSGIYHPVGLGWIARDIDNTSIGMAYNGMFGNLGLAVAPLFAGLVNLYGGTSAVYIVVGIVNFSGIFLLLRARNKSRGTSPVSKKKIHASAGALMPFVILLIAMMLGGIVYRGTSVTLPAYFELSNKELFRSIEYMFGGIGTENVVATFVTSMIYLLGMIGQYTGGKVGERFDLRKGYLVFHLITIPAAIAMAFTTNMPLIGFALIHSFFLLGMQPIENTLVSRLAPPSLMSSAFGVKFILTFGVGALGVKIIEVIKTYYGFSVIYLALAGISIALVLSIAVLMRQTSSLQFQ